MSCGCVNVLDKTSGALYCTQKCPLHAAMLHCIHDEDYYHQLVPAWRQGISPPHMGELEEAIGPIPCAVCGDSALELGCGLSPYARSLEDKGYRYLGLDNNPVAVRLMWDRGFRAINSDIMGDTTSHADIALFSDLVLAAHVLEHMPSAPVALGRIRSQLRPGGKLVLVLPDDTDLYNPEHYWFFKEESLCHMVEQAGFEILRSATRSIVPKENFIYVLAQRKG